MFTAGGDLGGRCMRALRVLPRRGCPERPGRADCSSRRSVLITAQRPQTGSLQVRADLRPGGGRPRAPVVRDCLLGPPCVVTSGLWVCRARLAARSCSGCVCGRSVAHAA